MSAALARDSHLRRAFALAGWWQTVVLLWLAWRRWRFW